MREFLARAAVAVAGVATIAAVAGSGCQLRPEVVADGGGADLFGQHCARCHGLDDGSGGTANARAVAFEGNAELGAQGDDYLFAVIKEGGEVNKRSPEMHAFGEQLSDAQIHELVLFLRDRLEGP